MPPPILNTDGDYVALPLREMAHDTQEAITGLLESEKEAVQLLTRAARGGNNSIFCKVKEVRRPLRECFPSRVSVNFPILSFQLEN